LADLLSEKHFKELGHELKAWALHQRKPWTRLLLDVGRGFFPPSIAGVSKSLRPAPWLDHGFVGRNQKALTGYESRLKVFGPRPSFQENLRTLDALRRQLGCDYTPCDPPYRKRYPYLDRDLLEFLFAVPRRQLIRPGQRRYLIRHALAGIVPDEVLNRKRKAFVVRSPLVAITTEWPNLMKMTKEMMSVSLGLVCVETFREAMRQAGQGEEVQLIALMRTVGLEVWLKGVQRQGILTIRRASVPDRSAANDRPEALTDFTRSGRSFFEELS
jgi:asparagine synthase (glutamine-hydrolysing)